MQPKEINCYIVLCDGIIKMVTTDIDRSVKESNKHLYNSLYDWVSVRHYVTETTFIDTTIQSDDVDLYGHGFANVDGTVCVREIFAR